MVCTRPQKRAPLRLLYLLEVCALSLLFLLLAAAFVVSSLGRVRVRACVFLFALGRETAAEERFETFVVTVFTELRRSTLLRSTQE